MGNQLLLLMLVDVMELFVFGLVEREAGKTTVSRVLLHFFKDLGLNFTPFKPMSGHNLWYQWLAFKQCIKQEKLFCEDIYHLREAANTDILVEILNPVDLLLAPLDLDYFISEGAETEFYMSDPTAALVMERITMIDRGEIKNMYLVNSALETHLKYLKPVVKKLLKHSDEILTFRSRDEQMDIHMRLAEKAINTCYRKIVEKTENVLIESFNDAVMPCRQVLNVNVPIGVAPAHILIFNPLRWKKALSIITQIKHPSILRAQDIIPVLKPEKIFKIPPIPKKYLSKPEKIIKNYKSFLEHIEKTLKH